MNAFLFQPNPRNKLFRVDKSDNRCAGWYWISSCHVTGYNLFSRWKSLVCKKQDILPDSRSTETSKLIGADLTFYIQYIVQSGSHVPYKSSDQPTEILWRSWNKSTNWFGKFFPAGWDLPVTMQIFSALHYTIQMYYKVLRTV